MITLYQSLISILKPVLPQILERRVKKGKEDPARLGERMGNPSMKRPSAPMGWVHAASVGEAQSALILINAMLNENPELHILMTTGTKTSANLMNDRLPSRAFHQYYPLDHPDWCESFLDHWQPHFVLWMESELWPNMLSAIKARDIPAALINARLSPSSFKFWSLGKSMAKALFQTFDIILAQNENEAQRFKALGAQDVRASGNLKYSAKPLAADEQALAILSAHIKDRPCWVYASTHEGEETLAAQTHQHLKNAFPNLLTIIIPRHPERGDAIEQSLSHLNLNLKRRSQDDTPPDEKTDLYLADTLGELGLFYRLAPVACIGRSFSDDGGGGHNPIEAAQLNCAVLHGPHIQNLQEIFDAMEEAGASIRVANKAQLSDILEDLFNTPSTLESRQKQASQFALKENAIIDHVMDALAPLTHNALVKERPQAS